MLRSFSSVEYPTENLQSQLEPLRRLDRKLVISEGMEGISTGNAHGAIQSERNRGNIPSSAGLSSGRAEECDFELVDHFRLRGDDSSC